MAENLPGPYEVEFELTGWTSPARSHVFRVSCAAVGSPTAGTLPTAIDIQKMGGSTAKLNVVANQLWEFMRLWFTASIACNNYTLWRYVPGTLAKDFIAAGTLTNAAGSAGGSLIPSHQVTQTYRSANGGILKLVILESINGGDARSVLTANPAGTNSQRLASYVMSADNIILARDDAYPVTPLRDSRGQNEKLWRLLNR